MWERETEMSESECYNTVWKRFEGPFLALKMEAGYTRQRTQSTLKLEKGKK